MEEFVGTFPVWVLYDPETLENAKSLKDAVLTAQLADGRKFLPIFTDADLASRAPGGMASHAIENREWLLEVMRDRQGEGVQYVAFDPGPTGGRLFTIAGLIRELER